MVSVIDERVLWISVGVAMIAICAIIVSLVVVVDNAPKCDSECEMACGLKGFSYDDGFLGAPLDFDGRLDCECWCISQDYEQKKLGNVWRD